jgi:hypothetical protein
MAAGLSSKSRVQQAWAKTADQSKGNGGDRKPGGKTHHLIILLLR